MLFPFYFSCDASFLKSNFGRNLFYNFDCDVSTQINVHKRINVIQLNNQGITIKILQRKFSNAHWIRTSSVLFQKQTVFTLWRCVIA